MRMDKGEESSKVRRNLLYISSACLQYSVVLKKNDAERKCAEKMRMERSKLSR